MFKNRQGITVTDRDGVQRVFEHCLLSGAKHFAVLVKQEILVKQKC